MLLQQKSKGHFNNLFQFIRNNDDKQFFKFTRIRDIIRGNIRISKKKKYSRISLTRILIMYNFVIICNKYILYYIIFIFFKLYYNTNILFCNYLALGSMQSIAWKFYMSKSTEQKDP